MTANTLILQIIDLDASRPIIAARTTTPVLLRKFAFGSLVVVERRTTRKFSFLKTVFLAVSATRNEIKSLDV